MNQSVDLSEKQNTSNSSVQYRLRLFVAGNESNSVQARNNLNKICEEHLNNCCEVEIIDVLSDFQIALKHHIIVTPTLILTQPEPRVIIVGNLGDRQKVLAALRLI